MKSENLHFAVVWYFQGLSDLFCMGMASHRHPIEMLSTKRIQMDENMNG